MMGTAYPNELDRGIVNEGYPSKPGLHLLWSHQAGWPVVDLVRVEVSSEGVASFWKGVAGSDRQRDIPRMFNMWFEGFLGHSAVSAEALAYYEEQWQTTSTFVKLMLATTTNSPLPSPSSLTITNCGMLGIDGSYQGDNTHED